MRTIFALNKFIEDENIAILALQETGAFCSDSHELANMNMIMDTNKSANKGVALYVNDKYTITKLDEISKISKKMDSCWGLVIVEKKRYIIGNVYVKLNYNQAMNDISKMLTAAEEMQKKHKASGIILTGDFNARHQSWGDKMNNNYGNKLVDTVDFYKYSISTSKTPTFLCSNGSSFIDLFIISNNIAETLNDCYTNEEVELFSGSPQRGHVPVIIELLISSNALNFPVVEKLDIESMKWADWEQHIEERINNEHNIFDTENDPDTLWSKLDEIITEATSIYCGTKKSSVHSKPYWTPNLTALSKDLRKARKAFIYRNTPNNLQNLTDAKNKFDDERKEACESFIMNKAKDLNAAQALKFWRNFNRLFKKKTKQKVDPLINEKGELITEIKELDQCLFSAFFEGKHLLEQNFDDVFYHQINNIYSEIIEEEYINVNTADPIASLNEHITIKEIKKAIKTNGKSIDNYNVHPLMIKHLGKSAMKLLQKIFNLSLRKHVWLWKKAEVIFLRKPDKDSYSKPGSYRPICITAYIGKLLESIIAIRIENLLLQTEKTDPYQEGFSAKKNTIRYLNRLHLGIESDKENNLTTLGLFIDFEKAFDSVWKKGLMVKLYKIGIRGDIFKLINSFLFSRQIKLNVNGVVGDERSSAEYGLPQGSVISPVLFKIYVMDFVLDLNDNPCFQVLKFADDGTIKISGEDSPTCIANLEVALESLKKWSHKWRLKINCEKNKTEVVCFHTAENDKSLIPDTFKLGDKDILRVPETKVLGVVIDEGLTYQTHTEILHKNLLGRWATICRYTNRHWGFKVHVMMLLLYTLFLSKIWYGNHIWQTKENTTYINQLYYRMIKSITGAVLNIKKNVAEFLLGVPPIEIQTKVHGIKHFLKIINTPVQNDVYKQFISDVYDHNAKKPISLHKKYKDIFSFLEWKFKIHPTHFNDQDINIISNKRYDEFANLSPKSCTYTRNMVKGYTEDVLWSPSLRNEFQIEGYASAPTPSCCVIPLPRNITREAEIQVISLFYKNNTLNQSMYNLDKVPSPLCTYCNEEEETADHLLFRCSYVSDNLKLDSRVNYRKALKLSDEDYEPDIFVGLLDASKNEKFVSSCVEIVKCLNIKVHVIL